MINLYTIETISHGCNCEDPTNCEGCSCRCSCGGSVDKIYGPGLPKNGTTDFALACNTAYEQGYLSGGGES